MSDPGGVRFDKPGASGPPAIPGVQFTKPAAVASLDEPVFELAGWGRRAAAALIDGFVAFVITALLVGLAWVLVISAFPIDWEIHTADDSSGIALLLLWLLAVALLGLVVSLTYAPLWMWRTNGRTLGKQMLGIRVVRADGTPMSFGFAVFREFLVKGVLGAIASSLTLYLYLLADILWPLVDSERRALHDHIARTRVVRD